MAHGKKSSSVTFKETHRPYLADRLEQISRLLIQERSAHRVGMIIREKWGVSRRRASQYIQMVSEIWVKRFKGEIIGHGVRAVADREEVIRLALKAKNFSTALRAMDSRDKVLGVLRDHMSVSGQVGMMHKMDLGPIELHFHSNSEKKGGDWGADRRGLVAGAN